MEPHILYLVQILVRVPSLLTALSHQAVERLLLEASLREVLLLLTIQRQCGILSMLLLLLQQRTDGMSPSYYPRTVQCMLRQEDTQRASAVVHRKHAYLIPGQLRRPRIPDQL